MPNNAGRKNQTTLIKICKKKDSDIRENQDKKRRHGVPEGAEESSHSIILYEDLHARLQDQHVSSDRRARLHEHEEEGQCIVNTLSWDAVLGSIKIVLYCTVLYSTVQFVTAVGGETWPFLVSVSLHIPLACTPTHLTLRMFLAAPLSSRMKDTEGPWTTRRSGTRSRKSRQA
jgi:hypothetical protein